MPVTRLDPTRLLSLRRAAIRNVRGRFAALGKAVQVLIVSDDVFGLVGATPNLLTNAQTKRWQFLASPEKVDAFQSWLADQVERGLMAPDTGTPLGQPWLSKNLNTAYRSGALRAYRDAKRAISGDESFLLEAEGQFLESMHQRTVKTSALRLLYTRQYSQLRGVTDAMSGRLGQILAAGLADGKSPKELAREIAKAIDVSRQRAETIALTEITNAHSNGQLDAFEALGIDSGLTIMAEWTNATNPCKACASMNGVVLTIKEARGLIPRHPRCACCFTLVEMHLPAVRGQKRSKAAIKAAIAASVKAETGKSSVREATKGSKWRGASLKEPKTKRRITQPVKVLTYPAKIAKLLRSVNKAK